MLRRTKDTPTAQDIGKICEFIPDKSQGKLVAINGRIASVQHKGFYSKTDVRNLRLVKVETRE